MDFTVKGVEDAGRTSAPTAHVSLNRTCGWPKEENGVVSSSQQKLLSGFSRHPKLKKMRKSYHLPQSFGG